MRSEGVEKSTFATSPATAAINAARRTQRNYVARLRSTTAGAAT